MQITRKKYDHFAGIMIALCAVLWLSACASPQVYVTEMPSEEYLLNTGDKIKITVFDEDELSGEFRVDERGYIAMPLIGKILIGSQTIDQAEDKVTTELQNGYLKSPKVAMSVIEHRPFYILGAVRMPGSYPYIDGISVTKAVALSGGFTYRADRDNIILKRPNDGEKSATEDVRVFQANLNTLIHPGDIIEVKERWF